MEIPPGHHPAKKGLNIVGKFSLKTKLFIGGTILIGLVIGIWYLRGLAGYGPSLLVLAALAAAAQVLKVEGATSRSSYNISWLVYGFTFVFLGPTATFFVILVSHLVEWIWHKYPWYIQLFNIGNYAIALLVSDLVYHGLQAAAGYTGLVPILAILAAFIAFTLVNHFMVGMVILLARGQSFSQSGVFDFLTVMIDFSLIGMGAGAALIWSVNPFGVVLTLLPLYLIYSTLKVPALQRQTELDPKTKLYNARYFANALEKELSRAEWFNRPLTLVMGDLDLLRNINNTYGHLAGDVVLIGVAEILQKHAREYDVVARFGGEEFAILMPETTPEEAYPIVEAMRQAIESNGFEVSTSVTPIEATMSFGITERYPSDKTSSDIIHNADTALYHSKLKGRNLITVHEEEFFKALFTQPLEAPQGQSDGSLDNRIAHADSPYVPDPIRESGKRPTTQPGPSEPDQDRAPKKTSPVWRLPAYIGGLAILAATMAFLTFSLPQEVDWLALGTLAVVVALTEILSIEIYIKETSISTATVPLVAGALLFGSMGALVLSLTLATTAFIKYRSKVHKYIFNASNHVIYTSFIAMLAVYGATAFAGIPVLGQILLSLAAAMICYFGSTALLAGAMGISSGQPIRKLWMERFCWLWPYYAAYGVLVFLVSMGYTQLGIFGILMALVPLFMVRISQAQYIDHTRRAVQELRSLRADPEQPVPTGPMVSQMPTPQWMQASGQSPAGVTAELHPVEGDPGGISEANGRSR